MSIASDLTAAFAELELTVPVALVGTGTVTRAFFDRRGSIRSVGGIGILAEQDVLTIQRGTLAGAAEGSQVLVGPLGAATADATAGAVLYVVTSPRTKIDDGALETLSLAGGADS